MDGWLKEGVTNLAWCRLGCFFLLIIPEGCFRGKYDGVQFRSNKILQ